LLDSLLQEIILPNSAYASAYASEHASESASELVRLMENFKILEQYIHYNVSV